MIVYGKNAFWANARYVKLQYSDLATTLKLFHSPALILGA